MERKLFDYMKKIIIISSKQTYFEMRVSSSCYRIYIQREHISILKLKWKFTRVSFIEARYLSFCKYISLQMLTLKLASASS